MRRTPAYQPELLSFPSETAAAELVHWRFDDPLGAMDDIKRKRLFQLLREEIAQRVRLFALVQVRFAQSKNTQHNDQQFPCEIVHTVRYAPPVAVAIARR